MKNASWGEEVWGENSPSQPFKKCSFFQLQIQIHKWSLRCRFGMRMEDLLLKDHLSMGVNFSDPLDFSPQVFHSSHIVTLAVWSKKRKIQKRLGAHYKEVSILENGNGKQIGYHGGIFFRTLDYIM